MDSAIFVNFFWEGFSFELNQKIGCPLFPHGNPLGIRVAIPTQDEAKAVGRAVVLGDQRIEDLSTDIKAAGQEALEDLGSFPEARIWSTS